MALSTGNRGMRSGQLELRQGMIKGGRAPAIGRVTLSAGVIVISQNVVRVGRAVEVTLVTAVTIGGQTPAVIATGMALDAIDRTVVSGQRE
jgi:hypothetical protein